MGLFVRKSINVLLSSRRVGKGFKENLSSWSLIALGIGAIIGAGCFHYRSSCRQLCRSRN